MQINKLLIIGIIFLFLISLPNVHASLSGDFWAYYTMNATSGNEPDVKGNSTLTAYGTIGNRAGLINNSRGGFLVDTNYMANAPTSWAWTGMQNVSINTWVYVDSTDSGVLLSKGRSDGAIAGRISYDLYLNANNSFTFGIALSSTGTKINVTSNTSSYAQWHMITTTYNTDTQSMKIYIDGVLSNSGTWTGGTGTDVSLWFGNQLASSAKSASKSYLDEVGVTFNRTFSQSDIDLMRTRGLAGQSFPFPDTSGSITFTSPTPSSNQYIFTNGTTTTVNISVTLSNINTTDNKLNLSIYKDGVLQSNTFDTILSTNAYKVINVTSGNYTINASGTNVNNASQLITTLPQSFFVDYGNLVFTALNMTGGSINSFTVQVNGTTYSTTSGTLTIFKPIGSYYALFNTTGYAYANTTINLQNSSTSYQFKALPSNFINLSIYDALTSLSILQPMNVVVTASTAVNYSTSTGNILLFNLEEGLNELKVYNVNYSEGRIYVYVDNFSASTNNIYLLSNASTTQVIINWYDVNGAPISPLYVTESVVTANGSVLAASYYTDIDGASYFTYNSLYYYIYNCTSSTYQCEGFILNPPRKSSYDVTLGFLASTPSYSVVNVSGNAIFYNSSKILNFSYSSFDSSVSSYSYIVYHNLNGVDVNLCSGSSSSSSYTFSCNLTGYSGLVFVSGFADSEAFYGSFVDLGNISYLSDRLGAKDTAYITGFLMLLVTFFGLAFGVMGTLIMGVVALTILYFFHITSLITVTFIIVDVVVVLIIVFNFKRRNA